MSTRPAASPARPVVPAFLFVMKRLEDSPLTTGRTIKRPGQQSTSIQTVILHRSDHISISFGTVLGLLTRHLEIPSFTPLRAPLGRCLSLQPRGGGLSAPKRRGLSISVPTPMLGNLRLTVFSALPVINGFVSGPIRHTARFHGTLIARVVLRRRCMCFRHLF